MQKSRLTAKQEREKNALLVENERLRALVERSRSEMIGEAELKDGDDTYLSDVVLQNPKVVAAMFENAEMKALYDDQMAYMGREARGNNAKKGMRWHPR